MLEVKKLSKTFGSEKVLHDINMKLETGKFYTFLGPSGCGKTTALRIIAGLETADAGTQIIFEEKDITHLLPSQRGIGFVFQNYALFPHLSVYDNINYGLKAQKVDKQEAKKRIDEVLAITRLEDQKDKLIDQLSGGQQQRVAIARSIVMYPKLLLLDEPMSNLDAELKESMLEALMDIQERMKLTIIYVTHDQKEAMLISDEILVFSKGKLIQRGNNMELYREPHNRFVANFIGDNHIHSREIWAQILGQDILGPAPYYCLRTEAIHINPQAGDISIQAEVDRLRFYGSYVILKSKINDQFEMESFIVGNEIPQVMGLELGQEIELFIQPGDFVGLED